jgi:hypothetical protein
MSAKTTQQIRQSLTKKRFIEDKTHHCYFHLYINGKKTSIYTLFSHGKKECGDSLLAKMARELRLKRKDFNDLIDCPLGKEAYIQMLKDMGEL